MNREARRYAKMASSNKPRIKLNKEQLEAIKGTPEKDLFEKSEIKKAIEEAAGQTLKKMFGLTLLTMQREYGWKKKRLNRLLGQLIETQQSFEGQKIKMEDLDELFRYLNVKC